MGFQRAFQNTMTPTVKAFDRHVHFHMIPHHNVRQTHTHWWPPASSYICSACKHSVRSAFYPWKCAVFEGGKSHRIVLAVAALNPTSHRIEVRAKLSPKVVGRQWRTGWRRVREWCDEEKGGGSPTRQKGHKLWEPRQADETGKRGGVINWCGC